MRKIRSAKEVAKKLMSIVIFKAQQEFVSTDEIRRGRPELTTADVAERVAEKIIIYAHIEMIDKLLRHVKSNTDVEKILLVHRELEKARV